MKISCLFYDLGIPSQKRIFPKNNKTLSNGRGEALSQILMIQFERFIDFLNTFVISCK